MQLKIEISDELASRLSPHQGQLPHLLELGLDKLTATDDAEEPNDDELPEGWLEELRRVAQSKRRHLGSLLPESEELVAYHHGRLGEQQRDALQEKLTLDPNSRSELLDLMRFPRLEPPGEEKRLSKQDVAAALERFHARLKEEESKDVEERKSPESSVATVSRFPVPPTSISKLRHNFMTLAAVIVSVVAAGWIFWLYDQVDQHSNALHGAVIDIASTRGVRPFEISPAAEQLLLILPPADLKPYRRGVLEISAAGGEVIRSYNLRPANDDHSLLYLTLPHEQLPEGSYQITLFGLGDGSRKLMNEYRFAIRSTVPR